MQFEAGRSLVSKTTLPILGDRGSRVQALRAVLTNPRTTVQDLAAILEEQARIGARLR